MFISPSVELERYDRTAIIRIHHLERITYR